MRRRAQGFTLIEIMVVIAIIAGLVTTVAIVVPKMQETQRRTSCMGNQAQLGQVFLMQKQENAGKAMRHSGVALWLSYRKDASEIKRGEEKALICMGDVIALPENEEDKKKWDNVDLENPRDDLCSYAARDFKNFKLDVESKDKEIIGSDRQGTDGRTMHHKGGIVCVYEAGDAQWVTKEELGLSNDTDTKIVIGPDGSGQLKKVVYIVSKKN